ncbi:MAG: hypothetical protein ACQESE_00180 [Nanobdellota archaeon]
MTDILADFIKRFTDKELFSENDIVSSQGEYYLVPKPIRELVSTAREEPSSQGLYLGHVKDGVFHAGATLLQRLTPLTDKKIVLNEKAAWLFVCGRDVFSKNIVEEKSIKTPKGLVLVLDTNEEVVGLAKPMKSGGQHMFRNITDIGNRLRREKR